MQALEECVREAQQNESKEIFYSVITEKELEMRKKRRDALIYSMSVLPRSMVIGSNEEFVM
jgi:hypothetical protein